MNKHLLALLNFIRSSSLYAVHMDEVHSITINLVSGSKIQVGKIPCADLINHLDKTVPNWRQLIDS